MTPRKTLLAAAMATGLLVSVTACGSDDGNGDDNGGSSSEERDSNGDDGDDGDEDDAAGGGGGLDDLSGAEIAEQALDATQTLESMRMSGEISEGGETIALDLRTTTDGSCEGTVDMGEGAMEFVNVEGASYFKYPPEFYEANPDMAEMEEMLGDNWLLVEGEGDEFAEFCSLDILLTDLADIDDPAASEFQIVEGETVEGNDTVGLMEEGDEEVVLYVVDDIDAPYIAKLAHESEGEVIFSDFNEDFAIEAPPAGEVVDPADFGAM